MNHLLSRFTFFTIIILAFASQVLCGNPKHGGGTKSRSYFGVSAGINYYFGDLKNNNIRVPLHYRYGIQISAEREIFRATRLCINIFNGNLIGDELEYKSNLNFKTTVFAPQIGLSYNLLGISNSRASENFALYVSAGIEGVFFSTSGDLKNSAGEKYYYWSDGTLRNMPENFSNLNAAQEISRDNIYETNYRNLDIDNIGQYPKNTLGIPLGLAFEASLNMGLALRLGAVYHITFTDYLDNISANSVGTREGNPENDKFLYIHAGIFYKLPVLQARHAKIRSCGYKNTNYGNKRKINRVN